MVDVALPNLTRDQAVERAALVTVDSYRIDLDLTDGDGKPGEHTFRSMTTVEFDALAGADTYIDIAADSVRSATLNGRDIDVSGYDESTGIPLTGLAEHNVLVVDADCRYSNTGEGLHRFVDPVDGEVYLYSQFETADAKRMFACFDQPDLKADVRRHGHRARALAGHLQRRARHVHRVDGDAHDAHLRDHAADEHLPRRADRRARTRAGTTPTPTSTATSRSACTAARRWPSTWTHERLFTETKQGFGFYHKNFGVPYAFGKYDQLFVPEFNAGAMENAGRGDVPGGLRLPQQGHPRVLRAARRDRAARDGAHVVRRPRHDAVVGRPVAQRVVRDVRLGAVPGRGDRVHRGVDDIRERGEVLGLPAGPAAVDAPGRRRHPRPGRRRGELRRHHLRQGRQRAQAAGRLRRAGGVPGRPAGLLPRPRLRQRHLRRPARRAGEGVGPRPVRLGAAVAQDHRAQHAAPRLRRRRRRAVHPLRDHPERCAAGRR